MEKRPIFGRFILVAVITGLAVWQWYPPTPRDVLEVLQEKFVDRESAEAKRIISQLKQFLHHDFGIKTYLQINLVFQI